MVTRHRLVLAGSAVLVLVAIGGLVLWAPWGASSSGQESTAAPVGRTVQVTTGTVAKTTIEKGTLRYPAVKSPTSRASGTLTAVPAVGTSLGRGDTVYEVDTVPTVLLLGTVPVWRDLSVGAKGADVLQLEQNLSQLGYFPRVPDEEFLEPTAEAVRKWQKALKIPETGEVPQSAVVVAPDVVRVGATPVAVETPVGAGTTVLTLTAHAPSVQVMLPLADQGLASVGAAVSVTMPDGTVAPAAVTSIGRAQVSGGQSSGSQSQSQSQDDPTAGRVVPVEIALSDPAVADGLQEASVQTAFIGDRHDNVLTVPVDALLARAGGGYELDVIGDDSSRHRIPVTVGLVADGVAEVSGDGLHEALTVGAASA
ncbi:peptidoglycan-binding protein [Rathayibacter rathayi]|uniref:peptidoglycan-binding domain-containing protein n=1 Tax=Rathayibacter rathayi TaxID=33887 RepID=UPI000CE83968|nr:peptidoglycan-binding domain-containing protein [Rathayibacter rathayi]PPG41931.1 peptidoglycan-binding protein [Rathayibacter rathayi]